MSGIALVILTVFAAGAVAGVLVVAAWAIRREDRAGTLMGQAPDWLSRGVRRVMGVGLRNVAEPEQDARELTRR